MAASSGISTKTPNGESERPTYKRSLTLKRKDAERELINDLAKEVCQWLSQILDVEITPENYLDKLDTGVELCRLQNKLVEGGEEIKISYNANAKKKSMHAQENITHFIKWCKDFIHSDEVLESNDLVDHKNELKCQTRVLLCLDKVRKRYTSVGDTEVDDNEPKSPSDVTDQNNPSDLPQESEGNNEEKKQKVASSIQEPASNNDGDESNPSSPKPISSEQPQEEESEEEKEGKPTDNSAPEPTAVHVNSEIRSRHSARNEQSQEETSQKEDKEVAGDHNPSGCSCSYLVVFLCIISLVFLVGLYFLK